MKILFKNCMILLREHGTYYTLNNAFLGVDGDVFSYIGTEEPAEKFDEVEDLSGKLVIPGLYNCHTHSPMVLLRGAGNDTPLDVWLTEHIFPRESKLNEKSIKVASELAIMEMLAGGTVAFSDMYFFPEVTAEVVAASGIKANLTKHLQNPTGPCKKEDIAASLQFVKEYNGLANGRILADFGIHSCYLCDAPAAREYSALCREYGGRMHIHLSETQKEYRECVQKNGVSPTEWFDACGALGENTLAAHCVMINENDLSILAQRGVHTIHCPSSNLKLGSGFAAIPVMLEKGISVAIGTDGAASNNNLNMLEEMHLASLIHKGNTQDPTVLNTDTVIDMATANGACVQGRQDCGTLKVGYKADFVVIDLDKVHLQTAFDKKFLLTYSAQNSDVYMTVVDGKILYKDSEFLTIDAQRVLFEFSQQAKALL